MNAALRKQSKAIKIRHTASPHDRFKEAHKLLGTTNQLAKEMEGIFNQWAKVKITDKQVKKLVQMAMAPNKETLRNLQSGRQDEFSSVFTNMVDKVLEYSAISPTLTDGYHKRHFVWYSQCRDWLFPECESYKDTEAKFKSIMTGNALGRAPGNV